ncbi:MAG: hypothetical protein KBD24_00885 [Candidatus Pacebacteria bacterium]|nr:hypothetical protein [Candidatus Paceibacterota bacterium]
MNHSQPLSGRIRSLLLWVLTLVFVAGTPLLILYSNGYRFDSAFSIVQTGGIYIHSDMANTAVYLDGDFVESNGAFSKNTYLQNLIPNRKYEIWLTREGYRSWTKELFVRPELVTEATLFMLPDSFTWATITATTTLERSRTFVGPFATTTKEIANPRYVDLKNYFEEDSGQFEVEVASTTYLTVRGKKVATTTVERVLEFPNWLEGVASTSNLYDEKKDMIRERNGILAWLESGNVSVVWAREGDAPPYYFCSATCTPMLTIDWVEDITRYEFFPNRNDVLVIGNKRGIYAVELDDRSQRNIQPFIEESDLDFRIRENGTLVIFDKDAYRETSW